MPRGPKPTRWRHAARSSFEQFFARRSEPLNEAPDEALEPPDEAPEPDGESSQQAYAAWLFWGDGDELEQVRAAVGDSIRNTANGLMGTFVALGIGGAPTSARCTAHTHVTAMWGH